MTNTTLKQVFGVLGNGRSDSQSCKKRADRADQSVLFFLAGAKFWEKHAKNCAIMSILDYFCSILDLLFSANFFGGKIGRCYFLRLLQL